MFRHADLFQNRIDLELCRQCKLLVVVRAPERLLMGTAKTFGHHCSPLVVSGRLRISYNRAYGFAQRFSNHLLHNQRENRTREPRLLPAMRCIDVEVYESSVLFAVHNDCSGVVQVLFPCRLGAEGLCRASVECCPLTGIVFAPYVKQRKQFHVIVPEPVGFSSRDSCMADLDFRIQRGDVVGRFAQWRQENLWRCCIKQLRSFRLAELFPAGEDHIAMRRYHAFDVMQMFFRFTQGLEEPTLRHLIVQRHELSSHVWLLSLLYEEMLLTRSAVAVHATRRRAGFKEVPTRHVVRRLMWEWFIEEKLIYNIGSEFRCIGRGWRLEVSAVRVADE